jgi:DNA mismatch repair protein MSH5
LHAIGRSLRSIKNIPKILTGLRKGQGSANRGGEWNSLEMFAHHTLKIRAHLEEMNGVRELRIYGKV